MFGGSVPPTTVSYPIILENICPRKLTGILRDAGFTFDAVKARLGTEYRMWFPEGAGVVGEFRAFFQRASMAATSALKCWDLTNLRGFSVKSQIIS